MANPLPPTAVKTVAASPNIPLPPSVINPERVGEMLFNTMVLYGPTGTRKTSQLGDVAKFIYETTGKKSRLLTMDGGGYGTIQDYVNAGIVEPWRLVDEERPLPMLVDAMRGRWPKHMKDGLRQSKEYTELRNDPDVGALLVEGWLSISNAVMGYLVASGQKTSEDVVSKFTEESDFGGKHSFGAPSRGHYGFTQRWMLDRIRDASSLNVEKIVYTSLEGNGIDKQTKSLSYGPATAGGALTSVIPQYVGDCLHFEDFQSEKGKDEKSGQKIVEARVRVWFTGHPDPQTNVMWPAKCRIVPSQVEEFKKIMGPNGYFDLNEKSLYDYLWAQKKLVGAGTDKIIEMKKAMDAKRAQLAEGK